MTHARYCLVSCMRAWRSPRSSPGLARACSSPSAIGTSIADTLDAADYQRLPAIGPHASLKYEAELRPLDKLGLSDVEMDATLTLVLTHVEGCARPGCLLRTQRDTGMTDAEWWVTQEPLLKRLST